MIAVVTVRPTILQYYQELGMGDILVLSYIMILKCHNNRYRREILSIVISVAQYYL